MMTHITKSAFLWNNPLSVIMVLTIINIYVSCALRESSLMNSSGFQKLNGIVFEVKSEIGSNKQMSLLVLIQCLQICLLSILEENDIWITNFYF